MDDNLPNPKTVDSPKSDVGFVPASPPPLDPMTPPDDVQIEPVPLPSVTALPEHPVPPAPLPAPSIAPPLVPPKPPIGVTPPVAFAEEPTIRPPSSAPAHVPQEKNGKAGGGKKVIAGIASLVFLVVALGSGLYLVRQRQDIRPFAANFADQDAVTRQRFESDWGDKAQEQWERERQLFEATGGEQNSGLWGGSSDQQTVQEFWDSGVGNNQASEEQRHEVVTEAQQAKEQALQQGVSEAEAAQAAKQAVKELEAPGVSPPGGTGVISGDAGGCYGMGNRDLEAQCIARAKSGQYTSGSCRTGNCLSGGYVVYCRGPQESAESPRAGEFLTCGLQFNSTGGCGQADVYASKGAYDNSENPIGFIIDKSGCVSQPPQVTTEEAPLREFPPEPTPPPGAGQCIDVRSQTQSGGTWVDNDLSLARIGDNIRFVARVSAAAAGVSFQITSGTGAPQTVAGTLLSSGATTKEYAAEYTIPASGQLSVAATVQ